MYPTLKRILDAVGSVVILLLLAPLLVLVALLVLLVDGRPVFFRQVRPGLDEEPFLMVKFRTMSGAPVVDDGNESARVTKLGKILRSTSIDELPSLWNIACGNMSFVGPRPLLVAYLGIYSQRHSQRHAVRPGLTGLAQVAGRNLLPWKERLDLDAEYIEKQSFLLDITILGVTIVEVFRRRGIEQADGSTMARLKPGYESD